MSKKNKAIFLDRDGVINKMYYHKDLGIIDTPLVPSQVEFMPGIVEFLKTAKSLGYLLILISSQPGVAIKKMTVKNFNLIRKKINNFLRQKDVGLDKEYYCLHHPFASVKKYRTDCSCRKPKIGLFEKAIKEFNIDVKKSWVLGDGVFDIIAGKNIGAKTILLANINEGEYFRVLEERLGGVRPDFVVKNLKEAREIIKNIAGTR